jgi:tetratricopeptide (TPR) repeat protein
VECESDRLTEAPQKDCVSQQDARRELDRILADPDFHCTERNRKFLRFVAEEYFRGRDHSVKAYTIAVDVFGRAASFDPSTDPIVRIEATRLRAALASYYELHGQDRPVRIDLPKGRYVPTFSRAAPVQAAAVEEKVQQPAGPGPQGKAALASLFPTIASRWASAGLGIAGGLLIGFLIFGFSSWSPPISEKPKLAIEMRRASGPAGNEALAVRDAFMVAMSGFQTARLSAPDATTASTATGAVVGAAPGLERSYRLILKYDADRVGNFLWWQIIDEASGEALRAGTERADTWRNEPPEQQLAFQLAVRLASSRGVINTIEGARELEHPTLGNGCVLRATAAIEATDKAALGQVRDCLDETLRYRPNGAEAHALLAGVLLKLDPLDAPTGLTEQAVFHAKRAVELAPDADRGYYAQMITQFRIGNIDAAIISGRHALSLNPNNPMTMGKLAHILFVTGRWDEGADLARDASRQVVDSRDAEATLAFDAYRHGRFDDTLLYLNQTNRTDCYCLQVLRVATLAQLGRFDEANATIAALRASRPNFEASLRADLGRRKFARDLVSLIEAGLAKAGLKVA